MRVQRQRVYDYYYRWLTKEKINTNTSISIPQVYIKSLICQLEALSALNPVVYFSMRLIKQLRTRLTML